MRRNAGAMIRIGRSGFPRFLIVASMLLISAPASTAQSVLSNMPPVSIRGRLFSSEIDTPSGQGNASAFAGGVDGPKRLGANGAQPANPDRGLTVPFWTDSFSYQGLTYNYRMVGTDPKRGSATTIVPTVIIPMRFVFENGLVSDASADSIDGQTSIQGIINSPVFQNYDFTPGGTDVGNTQYGDAFQRANFWDSVSKRSPDYHVLLGQPTIALAYEVFVPNSVVTFYPEGDGGLFPQIEESFLEQATTDALIQANISPQKLPIVVWGKVKGSFGGFHRELPVAGGTLTYIATAYVPRIPFFRDPDSYILSHEVLEWLDDPFGDNFTPGWDIIFNSYPHCLSDPITGDELEVADVFEFTPLGIVAIDTINGVYHLQEGAFIDYFTRNGSSRSVNGQYSFFGVATSPSPPCIGHLEIQPTLIEYPNATLTVATAINDSSQIVGFYFDQSDNVHGFIYDHGKYTQLDYPGAIETDLFGINNVGQIAGYYLDTAGLPHGFVYFQGRYFPVDFPGATVTVAFGINSRGDVIGAYGDASAVTHGFALQNGQFRSVDTPFGSQSEVSSINDFGHMAGIAFDNPSGPIHGFIFGGSSFSRFDFPGAYITAPNAINDQGEHGGVFFDAFGGRGYVTINGRLYALYYFLNGMNNRNQIVGNVFNFITNRTVGFVATLPN